MDSGRERRKIRYSVIEGTFAVCRLAPTVPVPEWTLRPGFFSITRTTKELSLVCDEAHVPAGIPAEFGWSCLQLEGPFPFAMSGVLVAFINPLAEAGIGIFAVSTFDTDYVLVKAHSLRTTIAKLEEAGHTRIG